MLAQFNWRERQNARQHSEKQNRPTQYVTIQGVKHPFPFVVRRRGGSLRRELYVITEACR
jgi:hypothetical protein